MAYRNNLIGLAAAAALALCTAGLSSVANAHAASRDGASSDDGADQTPAYEQVDSFLIWKRPYSWQPIDDKTVVVWSTPFEPYLVELAFPSHDMKFVQAIGVSSSGPRVYAKFDAITIRGFRYPINSIYKLSREEARNLSERHKTGNS